MENWALIDSDTDICVNVILWDGVKPYTPPAGVYMELAGGGQIGWKWDGTQLVDPNPPVEQGV